MVRGDAGDRRCDRVEGGVRQAADRQRVWRRGQGRTARHGTAVDEEFQAEIYRHNIGMLHKIPQLRGESAWILMDFRSPMRNYAGDAGRVQPQGAGVRPGAEEGGVLCAAEGVYKENGLGHAE
jgi:hypothetical protein